MGLIKNIIYETKSFSNQLSDLFKSPKVDNKVKTNYYNKNLGKVYKQPKMSEFDKLNIESDMKFMKDQIERLKKCDTINKYNAEYKYAMELVKIMVKWESKYPLSFKDVKPHMIYESMVNERADLQCIMIDNWISNLDRKLLRYTTDKGKRNNFIKEVDIFRYDCTCLHPDAVNYFKESLKAKYPQYANDIF